MKVIGHNILDAWKYCLLRCQLYRQYELFMKQFSEFMAYGQSSAGELNLRFHTKYRVVLFQFFLTYIDKNLIFKKHKICFYLLAKILHVCACALFRLPRSQREKFLPWHKNECLILFSNYMYWYDIWNRYNIAKLRLLNAIFIWTKVLMI